MSFTLRRLAGAGLLTLAVFAVAAGQPATGSLTGTIATADGARLPHATLTLLDQAAAREIRGTSDAAGAFVLDRVAPGTYTLRVDFPGLAPVCSTGSSSPPATRPASTSCSTRWPSARS
ncbi:MAG: carboxypeptidase-like regulatory domain-containing protein [Vicinamibacterales bacterium]